MDLTLRIKADWDTYTRANPTDPPNYELRIGPYLAVVHRTIIPTHKQTPWRARVHRERLTGREAFTTSNYHPTVDAAKAWAEATIQLDAEPT